MVKRESKLTLEIYFAEPGNNREIREYEKY